MEGREFAKRAVEHMKKTDEIVDPRAEESLEAALEIVRAKAKDPQCVLGVELEVRK